jgi:predicted small metal-binding protein
MLSLGCRDTGAGVLGCEYVAKGETEEELWRDGTEHLIKAHGMKAEDITPQFKYHYKQYVITVYNAIKKTRGICIKGY